MGACCAIGCRSRPLGIGVPTSGCVPRYDVGIDIAILRGGSESRVDGHRGDLQRN